MKKCNVDGTFELRNPGRIIKIYSKGTMTFNGKIFNWGLDLKSNLATAKFIRGGQEVLTAEETEYCLSPNVI